MYNIPHVIPVPRYASWQSKLAIVPCPISSRSAYESLQHSAHKKLDPPAERRIPQQPRTFPGSLRVPCHL